MPRYLNVMSAVSQIMPIRNVDHLNCVAHAQPPEVARQAVERERESGAALRQLVASQSTAEHTAK